MTIAIIAAIITAIIIIGIVIVGVYIYAHRNMPDKNHVSEIGELETVGVSSSDSDSITGDVRVNKDKERAMRPSDSLANRFIAFGALIIGVFGVIGSKIWSMQIMSKDDYSSAAIENLSTSVSTPAPRGCIYDRNGLILVNNKTSQTILASADVAKNNDVVKYLSAVLGIPAGVVRQRINDESTGAQSERIVESDARIRDVAFISEHADSFPGVTIESRCVREYPYGALASHVLGYTGTPSEEELKTAESGRLIEATDAIGKSGVERSYDSILAGEQGQRKLVVDAKGNIVDVISETLPAKGFDLHLSINSHVQYVADKALAGLIAPRGDIGTGKGVAGAVVAYDMIDGSIIAMASYPTFDPSYFINGIPQDIWDLYNTEESNAPMVNRCVNGQYAAASTFKAFTSMAGLHYGFADSNSVWECTGSWDGFGSGDIQKCWQKKGHGLLDLHGGIVNSCDVVFYEIAKAFFDHGPEGTNEISETALQDYLKMYRFGHKTGIDLSDESEGRIPTPEWKAEQWKNVPSEMTWVGGDYSNMIIGQGDVLITPLQLAVAYGGIATGKILKPHLIDTITNSTGDVVLEAEAEVVTEPEVNQYHLEYVRNSLHDMVSTSKVAKAAFEEAGVDVYQVSGKSGTAEHADRPDDAWFVAYGPYENPRYVVTCIIEEGGGGAEIAAPIVAKVMRAIFDTMINGEDVGEVGRIEGSSGKAVERTYTESAGRQD